ncbi:MAG: DsrE family protein [Candidatus Rokubacteria bacterium]|nr:DsrE family protein [Candidatus Rokubacteria bacterium]
MAVLIRRLPLASERASEALRIAVGQTLAPNRVTVVFIEDGVFALAPLVPKAIRGPEVAKHLGALALLGQRLVADADSLARRGLQELPDGIERLPRWAVLDLLTAADVVIPY